MTGFHSDYSKLAVDHAVHRSAYTDLGVFDAEQDRIFRRAWLYVGHESQIPRAGDWIRTMLGPDEMILIRGDAGQLSLLHNRCPHRSARLVTGERGSSPHLTCPYHAWSFDSAGALVGIPLAEGYRPGFMNDASLRSVARAPRVESYRGFVFASHCSTGPSLSNFLKGIAFAIDNLVDRAPEGRVRQVGGALRMLYRGNWKLFMENAVDLVHPGVVHASAVAAARADREAASLPGVTGQVVQMQLANGMRPAEWDELSIHGFAGGHVSMDSFYRQGVIAAQRDDPVFKRYFDALVEARGEARAHEILSVDRFNNLVWPNLSVNSRFQAIRVVQPLAPDLTQVTSWCFALEGAPNEMTRLTLRFLTAAASPVSLVAADDLEIFERCQRGFAGPGPEWIDISRGSTRDQMQGEEMSSPGTSEAPIRLQFGAWRRWMQADLESAS